MRDMFKYEKRNDYPHMNFRDKELWNKFIEKYPDAYKSCQYDFHLGDGPKFNTLDDDGNDFNQDMLYRVRADVIAFSDNQIDIIEIKPNAGPSTIGQVMGYWKLYMRDEEPSLNVGMVIITDKENPNMAWLCKQDDVKLIIV